MPSHLTSFSLLITFATVSLAADSVTVLLGNSLEISCVSSFPPPWTWYSVKDGTVKSLSIAGTKPHPNLNEPRYRFDENDNEYTLKITDVKSPDAGKFICDGANRQSTILNIVRYDGRLIRTSKKSNLGKSVLVLHVTKSLNQKEISYSLCKNNVS